MVLLITMLCLLACTLRLTYIIRSQPHNETGRSEMERAATTLASKGFIGNVYSDSSGKSAHVGPLYAAFLAGIYIVFGWDTVAGRVFQELFAIVATMIGICLLPLIARKARLPAASGWAAGFCMAVLPVNLWIEASGAWEQPYGALALLGMFRAFCTLREEQWRNRRTIALTGVLFGAAALLSPSLLCAGALMFIAESVSQCGSRKQVLLSGLVMLAVSLVFIAPWIARNYYALGGFIPVRSNFGLELLIGNNPYVTGKIHTLEDPEDPFNRIHPLSNPQENARLLEVGERAYMREKQQMALHWIKENPGRFAALTLGRLAIFWFPPVDVWPPSSPGRLFKSLTFCLIGAGMLCGLFRLWLLKHPARGLFTAALLGSTIIYVIARVDPRYRYPVFGLSTLIACDFVFAVGRYWFFTRRKV